MKILVNGTSLLAPLTGIGQYVRHLFQALEELDTQIHMFYGARFAAGVRLPSPGTGRVLREVYRLARQLAPRPRTLRQLAQKRLFAWQAGKFGGDALYHEPGFMALPYDGPLVLTVHDLSCFDHPETHPRERVRLMQRELPASIARAERIIVVSAATGEAVRRWFGVEEERLEVIHLAADSRFHPRADAELRAPLAGLGLIPGGYLLCVGTLEPRKNLPVLFAAYRALPDSLRRRYPLVVAGMSGWHCENMRQGVEELVRKGEIRFPGYVPDESLPFLYAGAAAFAYPSRYEGFGLPPLEAMASGVPVMTSNRTSLPEVVGDAGLMADPDDVDGFSQGLRRLLENPDEAADFARRGRARAAAFSWRRAARETREVYRQVLSRHALYHSCHDSYHDTQKEEGR
ncbi:MAG: glycosyltransferase family 4 protein [Zoogloeaceae bacterium]|jgi:alpha-1,3-rhamnosyl/mannosyltransferase|nr:glycosyltransferase family 4 protein [Zoogloeaceae bacterium]